MTVRELQPASFLSVLLAAAGTAASVSLLATAGVPLGLVIWPAAVSLFQFSVTPFLRETGIYRYHSALLKATIRTRRTYEVHGGTAFDYVFHFRWAERGSAASRRALVFFLEGFIDIARRVEAGELPGDIEISGTSYFFSNRTARRFGFRIEPAGLRLRLVLLLYFADLVVLYSFVKGRIAVPDLLHVRRAVIRGRDLAARRPDLEALAYELDRPAPGFTAPAASG